MSTEKKGYYVTLQASCTVKFQRLVVADTPDAAREKMVELMTAIDSGHTAQSGEFNNEPFGDASFEVTEAPKIEHDFKLDDIELEEDEDILKDFGGEEEEESEDQDDDSEDTPIL